MYRDHPTKTINPDAVIDQALEKFDRQLDLVNGVVTQRSQGEASQEVLRCPYCHLSDACDHLLLEIDSSNRDSAGATPIRGALFELFSDRLIEHIGSGMECQETTRHTSELLLEEVERIAASVITVKIGGFGGTESTGFFCTSGQATSDAVKTFKEF